MSTGLRAEGERPVSETAKETVRKRRRKSSGAEAAIIEKRMVVASPRSAWYESISRVRKSEMSRVTCGAYVEQMSPHESAWYEMSRVTCGTEVGV